MISCLPVLCLHFFAVVAEAQSNEAPTPNSTNIESEVSYLRNLAARGDATANYKLGCFYMTGTDALLNYSEAAKYLQAAADQGLGDAEFFLGYLYKHGKGVPRDYRKAFGFYAAAAGRGIHSREQCRRHVFAGSRRTKESTPS